MEVAKNISNAMANWKDDSGSVLWVAVGIIKSAAGEVLVAQRHASADQGGLWEFPGGKRELGESARAALDRELQEELGIHVQKAHSWLNYRHSYQRYTVIFDCWLIESFSGEPVGCEGQPLRWVGLGDLNNYEFPEGNKPIIAALRSC